MICPLSIYFCININDDLQCILTSFILCKNEYICKLSKNNWDFRVGGARGHENPFLNGLLILVGRMRNRKCYMYLRCATLRHTGEDFRVGFTQITLDYGSTVLPSEAESVQ